MSQELLEFSELIDEQFEIVISYDGRFWTYILNLLNQN